MQSIDVPANCPDVFTEQYENLCIMYVRVKSESNIQFSWSKLSHL